ncbi:MAG: hypothetical protein ACLU4B_08885, partial [Bilophila wadsworthia]
PCDPLLAWLWLPRVVFCSEQCPDFLSPFPHKGLQGQTPGGSRAFYQKRHVMRIDARASPATVLFCRAQKENGFVA